MTVLAFLSVAGLIAAFAARELLENAAWIAELLVRRALHSIPEKSRDLVAAEWLAELEYIRDRRSKLATLGWGFFVYWRSSRQGRILAGNEESPALVSAPSSLRELPDLHLATIEALALAIDAKDQTSQTHIRRVQLYAAAVGKAMGMSDNDVQGLKTAALLHDIGKLAVPEHILSKPGPLTPEEFQKIRAHPKVGADIVSSVPFPYPVAPLILSHHERWDGKGYPSGLKGEEIPLGARILSVVDYFDALLAERPYHKALSIDAAVGLLKQEAGKGLDPTVVARFIELLPSLRREIARLEETAESVAVAADRSCIQNDGRFATEPLTTNVFDDIALAHREINALYELAQAMGTSLGVSDTMALIAAKLPSLVPFTSMALFLYEESTETMWCRFANGIDAEAIQQITLPADEGLTGWVARNRRPLVNARPSADFEAAGVQVRTSLQSVLACPLMFNDEFIGTLSVYHTNAGFYRDDHRRLLDRVAEQAGAVIKNSIVFEAARSDSLTDAVTGLPNARHLFVQLERKAAAANRSHSELSVIVADLDGLKKVNDDFGYLAADECLSEVARLVREVAQPNDVCARWFSDKFVIVLYGQDSDGANRTVVELANEMERLTYAESSVWRRIRISTGVAMYRTDSECWRDLLDLALARARANKTATATATKNE
jgi:diguanylate cyclase (GGDEF)-like protein/putative nucleotidyltransferase with HDIG domain